MPAERIVDDHVRYCSVLLRQRPAVGEVPSFRCEAFRCSSAACHLKLSLRLFDAQCAGQMKPAVNSIATLSGAAQGQILCNAPAVRIGLS
jgi:hypothetical protein